MNKLSPIKGKTMKNEKGMVLVLAIFMLALLSMIGLSSMMTSTTDITIAGNEKFSKIVYYQAESGLTIGGEVARLFYYADTTVEDSIDKSMKIDNATNIDLKDSGFDDGKENTTKSLWVKNDQKDRVDDAEPDLQLSGDLTVNIDIDKLDTRQAPGGGARFGTGANSVKQYIQIYNVEALATLPANNSIRADHVMGYHINITE
jgi:Tfp pilus assembly protein PilX